jgi:hypothetical protein
MVGSRYCALVAVTTATEVGVATPSTGAGEGGVGVPPDGGGGVGALADEPPPPQAARVLDTASRNRIDT